MLQVSSDVHTRRKEEWGILWVALVLMNHDISSGNDLSSLKTGQLLWKKFSKGIQNQRVSLRMFSNLYWCFVVRDALLKKILKMAERTLEVEIGGIMKQWKPHTWLFRSFVGSWLCNFWNGYHFRRSQEIKTVIFGSSFHFLDPTPENWTGKWAL